MPRHSSPTINEAIERAMVEVDGPIDVDAFISKVLESRPSSAKKPDASIRTNLWRHEGKTFVYLDSKTIVPLRVAAPGVRFRIPLSRPEVERGVLFVLPSLQGWDSGSDPQTFQLVDEQNQPLPTKIVSIAVKQKVPGILRSVDVKGDAFDLGDWFQTNRARRSDSILVTIESWEPKRFKLELEPQKERRRRRDEIARRDQELAEILFGILEASADESIFHSRIVPTAYVRLSNVHGYPGSHWINVVQQDLRRDRALPTWTNSIFWNLSSWKRNRQSRSGNSPHSKAGRYIASRQCLSTGKVCGGVLKSRAGKRWLTSTAFSIMPSTTVRAT